MRHKFIAVGAILVGVFFWVQIFRIFGPAAGANLQADQSGVPAAQAAGVTARKVPATPKILPTVMVAQAIPTPGAMQPDLPAPPQPTATPASIGKLNGLQAVKAARGGDLSKINGIAIDKIIVIDDAVRDNVREIYARGQSFGRNPRTFSKVGDSTMAYPPLLADFDNRFAYRLGQFAYLQPTIDYFQGSFWRNSAAVKKGAHSWTLWDPAWVNGDGCEPTEGPLDCELRLNNPSIVIIRLGANDFLDGLRYNQTMRALVDSCLARGIIPILGTKPDRQEGSQNTINKLIYQIAADYALPVWDYDAIAGTLANRGLELDNIHMLAGKSHDYTLQAIYDNGEALEDLSALMMLDQIRQIRQ